MENQLQKKPCGLRKTRRKTPFFPRYKTVFAFCAKNSFGAKKGQKRGVAHKKSKTEAGQIDMKTGEFPP